jgi:hypothetical protein
MTTKEGKKVMFMEQFTTKKKEQNISVQEQLQLDMEWRITPWNNSWLQKKEKNYVHGIIYN